MIDKDLLNRNRNINRGYRKLVVWKEAIGLYSEPHNHTFILRRG